MKKKHFSDKQFFILASLSQWAWVIFLMISIPLIIAIIYTAIEVSDYTQNSQKTLFQVVKTTEDSRLLLERLISMERSIRQYQVLDEIELAKTNLDTPELFDTYLDHRSKFLQLLGSLQSQSLNKNLTNKLTKMQKSEVTLYHTILTNIKDQKLSFDHLTTLARDLINEGEKRVGTEAAKLSSNAQVVGKKLIYSALGSIPLALILGVIFVHLVTRPIKDIGKAIRNLGEVGFEQPIAIKGPKDLTELGQHLEWLRQKLNQLEYEKQQFIRNVSHELKTPLATLKEGTDLLSENVVGELNTEQQEIIGLMKMGNITLNDLVQNLLEYQRTISTKIEMNLSTFDLGSLINRISEEYQLLLLSKKITLITHLNPVEVTADHDKLRIIISNLFSNAVKFSPQNGKIALSLIAHKNNSIEIIIEDQGIGIAKNIQPLIFQDFYQGSSPKGWKIKASGLGLALVRHYLEAHHGTIQLLDSSKTFCGARFSLHLPQHQSQT